MRRVNRCIAAGMMMLIGAAGVVRAQSTGQSYQIERGDLGNALNQFATQSHLQIIYSPDLVKGKATGGLAGNFAPTDALKKLLVGSGLSVEVVNPSTFVLKKAPPPQPTSTIREKKPEDPAKPPPAELERVTVTGSRLDNVAAEGPVPVNIYTSKDIAQSGQSTLSDFLNTLPEVSTSNPENGRVFAGQTTVQLRGLPQGTTLILINGHRVEGSGGAAYYGGYFDLNNIPTAAIDRIEIVPEGSSAVYGSDALAGVVNIILKKNVDGLQINTHYGNASGIDEKSTDVAWGHRWDRGSFSVTASYYTRGNLLGSERWVTSNPAYGIQYAGCNPGNVYSTDGSNLPGLGTSSAGIKSGVQGIPTLDDFVPGTTNACREYANRANVIPPTQRKNIFAYGSYELTPSIELFTEIMYTHTYQDKQLWDRTYSKTLVPASNAYNPFGKNVLVSYQYTAPELNEDYIGNVNFLRTLVGARGDLFDTWRWEVVAWQSKDRDFFDEPNTLVNSANLANALASSDPSTALNLFSSSSPGSSALLASLYSDELLHSVGENRSINAYVQGKLFDLPAGSVDAVVGAEAEKDILQWQANVTTANYNFNFDRTEKSLFSELRVPLLAADDGAAQGGDKLAFNGAFRYDHYNDFGSKLTPQYALEWRPMDSLLIRGSYAKAFRAPPLVAVYAPDVAYPGQCCVTDPKKGGESVPYTYIFGGTPTLKAETGQSRSIGAVWQPDAVPGLHAQVTYWGIDQANRASQSIAAQTFVDDEDLFPGRVVRDPTTGNIESVNVSYINFGNIEVQGIDMGVSYKIDTSAGTFTPALSATETTKYRTQLVPGASWTDSLSKANDAIGWAPRWKGNVSLAWSQDPYSLSLTARYVSSYTDYQDLGTTTRKLGNFWIWDTAGKYEFGKALYADNAFLSGATVQVGVINMFNHLPQYSAFLYGDYGYDPEQADIRGRFIYVNLGLKY